MHHDRNPTGLSPSSRFIELSRAVFTTAGSGLTASMLRDIERGAPIEADHIVGDLQGGDENASLLVRLAYAHLKAYEARRGREMTLSGKAA